MARLTALAGIAIERKQSEEALRCSEARFRGLFENVIEGVYHATPDGRLESANPALVEMLGYDSVEDLLALPSHREPVCRTRRTASRVTSRCTATAVVRNVEFQLRRRDGTVITVVENARVVRDADGGDRRLRGHARRHHRAQARRDPAVRGEGEGAGHAAVDRRRGHHRRRRRPHRVPEPGGRGAHRLGDARGGRTAGRARCSRCSSEATRAADRQPDPALPARGPRRSSSSSPRCWSIGAARRSRSRTRPRRSATAAAS